MFHGSIHLIAAQGRKAAMSIDIAMLAGNPEQCFSEGEHHPPGTKQVFLTFSIHYTTSYGKGGFGFV
jgi:hypothetical protein